jgi:cellulose 1,4-beta-cellobiosidase
MQRRNSVSRSRRLAAAAVSTLAAALFCVAEGSASAQGGLVDRMDNPYLDAQVYVNPEWSVNAAAEPGGDAVADQPTAVWLDRIAAIDGVNGAMGLRDHLDEAVSQGADLIQFVIYNLPGRDCGRLAPYGELAPGQLDRYQREFIDPIAGILADPAYAGLRIVTVIEPNALPSMIINVQPRPAATPECQAVLASGAYVNGIGYALAKLGGIPNVYNYLDVAHHGVLGWPDNFFPGAQLFFAAANAAGATPADVHGFIANTAGYGVLHEEFFSVDDVIGGQLVRETSRWIDWNDYVDELSYVRAYRTELIDTGFTPDIGMLIDTSRNGWGGPNRPTGPASTTDPNAYVDGSRLDRRISISNWCNQAGAGLGARPTAAPEPGIDAYVWAKPPGESDGSSEEIPNDEGKRFDRMCDPTYLGLPAAAPDPTGALPDAPLAGHWFPAQFRELLQNAFPPVP